MDPKALRSCMAKSFQGGRGGDTFKTPYPYEQLLPFPTPCFRMFLGRSLNDPSPPHFKPLSLLPPPHLPPIPPSLKILIIRLPAQALPSQTIREHHIAGQSQRKITHMAVQLNRNLRDSEHYGNDYGMKEINLFVQMNKLFMFEG